MEFKEYFQREFSPKQTMSQIFEYGDPETIVDDWDIHRNIGQYQDDEGIKGMVFKLNHRNYTDCILITLDWDDTYHLRFMDEDKNVTKEFEGVYFDKLFETINDYINIGIITTIPKEQLN